jgi:hypothetical protein
MVPVTARRVREWPRLVIAAVLVAGALIGIGIGLASAFQGGGVPRARLVSQQRALRAQARALQRDSRQLALARGLLGLAARRLASLRVSLGRAQAAARCWRHAALSPRRAHRARCPAVR